ncbi:MAG: hypothetical protein IPI00_06400 [Flavobacteriales bacterium]|nr:hypothetical protein [Flavobacteriales bacterium]
MHAIDVGTGADFHWFLLAMACFPARSMASMVPARRSYGVKGVVGTFGLPNCTAEQLWSTDHNMRYDA